MELTNKTAFISGAGSGLGMATAKHFVEAGANVLLFDLDADRARELAAELGEKAGWAAGDVADEQSVAKAIARARELFGTIHINVNCAGIGGASRTVGKDGPMPLDRFAAVVRVNLVGTFNVLRLCAEVMQHNEPQTTAGERGVIINVASVAGYDGQTGQAAYAASKGGIIAMTLPVARDLCRQGIRVMTIAPGIFETPMLGKLPDEVRKGLEAITLFPKTLGKPEQFAQTAAHIVECEYLNAEVIRLDAGIRMPAI
ncbi:MAG: SDR family NAD(P)-dependent oxidoreductase [Gammaproteobacteria bacterium]|jgi:NAD(P)-dependent dehydrogenase (short-subunit alcohol dehydrogenase family)